MTLAKLESHLQDLFERRLEGEAFENLQEELRSNPEARKVYREYHHLENALRFRVKRINPLNVVPMDEVNARRQRQTIRNASLAAVALVTIGLIAMALILTRSPTPTLVFLTSPGTDFKISHIRFGEDAPNGQVLEPGSRMIIESGTVKLKFNSGVHAFVRGPADLTLQREDLLDLQSGAALFNVPEQAIGFKVGTPDFVLTDLGTEFGILAKPNFRDEVHVFKGEVEVAHRKGLKEKELLIRGQARVADSTGKWQMTPLRRDHFLNKLPPAAPRRTVLTGVTIKDVSSELVGNFGVLFSNFDRGAIRVLDGSGFDEALGEHNGIPDGNRGGGMWLNSGTYSPPGPNAPNDPNAPGAVITFDLGIRTALNSVTVWNYNETARPDLVNRGANDVEILIATSEGGEFTSIGDFNFTIAPGVANQNFGQIIDLSSFPEATRARLVRFNIKSNHGGDDHFVGLSEVRFNITSESHAR